MMFVEVARINDLPEAGAKGIELDGQKFILIRKDTQVFAYRNHCPHRGIPLEWQPDKFLDYEKQFIQCSTHGALFTLDTGECIAGPCTGQSLDPVEVRLTDEKILLQTSSSQT